MYRVRGAYQLAAIEIRVRERREEMDGVDMRGTSGICIGLFGFSQSQPDHRH